MPATHAPETVTRNLHEKFDTSSSVSCTKTTLRSITLHGSCHMLDSFCDGIELCSIPYQKLVPGKTCTRLTDTHVQVSGICGFSGL